MNQIKNLSYTGSGKKQNKRFTLKKRKINKNVNKYNSATRMVVAKMMQTYMTESKTALLFNDDNSSVTKNSGGRRF